MDLNPRRIPASKCPNPDCERLHQFNDVDTTDADRKTLPLGPGAVIICEGCGQVNMLANNLVLDRVWDQAFIDSEAVMTERWRIVYVNDIEPPDDLVRATARAAGDDIEPEGRMAAPLSVLHVWPSDSGLDFGYALSHGALPEVEFITTGTIGEGADMLFRVVAAAWPLFDWPDTVGPGTRFTFDTLLEYEYVLAPVPRDLAGDIGLPGGVAYLQVVVQDDEGSWPWSPEGDGTPILAGGDWRPDPADPVVLSLSGAV